MSSLFNLPDAISKIDDLTEENLTYREKYPFMDSDEEVEVWWNNLNENEQFKVGGLACHFGYMTVNCRWRNNYGEFHEVSTTQQRRIKKTYKRRNDKYFRLDPYALCGCA